MSTDAESTESRPPDRPERAERAGPPPPPAEADARYVRDLRTAGLLRELTDPLLDVFLETAPTSPDEDARRLDLLLLYYHASDTESAARRRRQDRFFLHDANEPASARDLVVRLSSVTPELGNVTLERIGSEDGPLVLRAGEHLAAVSDPEEEELDTGQIDLTELEDLASITVRGLVRAINVLLDRFGVRERLVPLPSDGRREAYAALPVAEAMNLCRAGGLDVTNAERLFDLAAW
ncbi:MAG: hypothetical protein MUE69_10455 [Myxococcota bacterium]|jgi:hypothetical protein|nr:hypothetical protein [Myxococcota bacterium]